MKQKGNQMIPETLDEISAVPSEVLTMEQIAPILGRSAENLLAAARSPNSKLGFAIIVTDTRVMVPKEAFLHFMRYGNAPIQILQK